MKGNRITLIGYVGSTLLSKKLEDGTKRVGILIATHYTRKNKEGENKWQTVWYDVVAWDKTAEYSEQSFVKRSKIMVEGEIEYRTYPDRTGHMRYITHIKAHSLMNLDR